MRPDLDDYEELNEPAAEPRSRAMSWVVLGIAVAGFTALAYYAYQSGTRSMGEGNMLFVEAQDGPIKETPADPGGEEFPHKDKTIYDALADNEGGEKVEKLLPEPEEPVIPKKETTTFVNESVSASEDQGEEAVNEAKPQAAAEEPAAKEAVKAEAAPPAPVAKPIEEKAAEAPKPEPTAEVKTEAKPETKPEPKPESVKEAPKPVAKPAAAPTGGDYKIQLGAFKSQEEANAQWNKITAKHGDLVKGTPIILRADLSNGTFYRLRATGFASADQAKSACTTLSGRGQPCFFAGK